MRTSAPARVAPIALLLLFASPAGAQVQLGWNATIDAGAATTSGNSETISLNMKADAVRTWLRNELRLNAGLVRTSVKEADQASGLPGRFAVGSVASHNVTNTTSFVPKAATYFAHGDFMHRVTERFFGKLGGDFERDQLAGLDSRIVGRGGVGYMWANRATMKFSTSAEATFTSESLTAEDTPVGEEVPEDTFPGMRVSADLERRFGTDFRNSYVSQVIVDQNLSQTSDTRLDWVNSLAVTMSRRLSLKTSVRLRYDNQPAFVEIDLFDRQPAVGVAAIGQVPVAAEKLDTAATVNLVVNLTPGRAGSRPTP